MDLGRAQRRRGIRAEVRIAGPPAEDHDAPLFEVTYRPSTNVVLGNLSDVDRRQDPGLQVDFLERVLQRHGIDHAGEHPHIVGVGAVHALFRSRHAANDIAAADHDADLDVHLVYFADLIRDPTDHPGVDAKAVIAGESFTGQLNQHAAVSG